VKLSLGAKIALSIVCVAGVFVAWGGIEAYRFLQTERGQQILRATRLAQESFDGPGSGELRGLGCEQAMLMTFRQLVSVNPEPYPPATLRLANETDVGRMGVVVCQNFFGPSPACDAVASTYVAATSPEEPFLVMVIERSEYRCGLMFPESGDSMGSWSAEALARLEAASE